MMHIIGAATLNESKVAEAPYSASHQRIINYLTHKMVSTHLHPFIFYHISLSLSFFFFVITVDLVLVLGLTRFLHWCVLIGVIKPGVVTSSLSLQASAVSLKKMSTVTHRHRQGSSRPFK